MRPLSMQDNQDAYPPGSGQASSASHQSTACHINCFTAVTRLGADLLAVGGRYYPPWYCYRTTSRLPHGVQIPELNPSCLSTAKNILLFKGTPRVIIRPALRTNIQRKESFVAVSQRIAANAARFFPRQLRRGITLAAGKSPCDPNGSSLHR